MNPIPLPSKINLVEESGNHNVFVIEPLYPGYGATVGNALRRVLLSSIPGAAVTAFKIRGIDHEFSTVPSVREDVIETMLNLKQLRLKVFSPEPVVLKLEASGEKEVKAADIQANDQVEIINKDLHIATLDGKGAELEMEIVVQQGRGYVPVEQREGDRPEIGLIQVDAVYSPVRNVSFDVENVRVGQMTNFDKLTLTVDTDGSVSGKEAMDMAARILLDHFTVLLEGVTPPELAPEAGEVREEGEEAPVAAAAGIEKEEDDLKTLNLSSRAVNALRKNGINTIADLRKYSIEELGKLEGLGEKSVNEIKEALEGLGK